MSTDKYATYMVYRSLMGYRGLGKLAFVLLLPMMTTIILGDLGIFVSGFLRKRPD